MPSSAHNACARFCSLGSSNREYATEIRTRPRNLYYHILNTFYYMLLVKLRFGSLRRHLVCVFVFLSSTVAESQAFLSLTPRGSRKMRASFLSTIVSSLSPSFAAVANMTQLVQNKTTLSLVCVTHTSRVKHKPCVWHSYKNTLGAGCARFDGPSAEPAAPC